MYLYMYACICMYVYICICQHFFNGDETNLENYKDLMNSSKSPSSLCIYVYIYIFFLFIC
jgi:hypothetical protein